MVLGEDDVVLGTASPAAPEIDERLLSAERSQMVREALAHLPRRWQRMLELMMADPPLPMPKYPTSWDFPLAASAPPAADAWPNSGAGRPPPEPRNPRLIPLVVYQASMVNDPHRHGVQG